MTGGPDGERGTYRGSWRTWTREPAAALVGSVAAYHGFTVDSGEPTADIVLPGPRITLILSFGDKLRMARMPGGEEPGGTYVSFVAGMHDQYGVIAHDGHQGGMQIDLDPLAARDLFGVDLGELSGDVVPLHSLLGRAGDDFAERLADTVDWPTRFTMVDEMLLRRLGEGHDPAPEVAHAWRRIRGSGGLVRVDELAREVGWSRRHLADRFRTEVGLAPKTAARVVRFDRARWLLGSAGARSLTDLAVTCGYYDHAHLDREFRALAGRPPSQLGDSARGRPVPGRG